MAWFTLPTRCAPRSWPLILLGSSPSVFPSRGSQSFPHWRSAYHPGLSSHCQLHVGLHRSSSLSARREPDDGSGRANYGFVGYQQQKPIIMGEYGAFKWAYPSVTDAAAGVQSWQIQSCAYNFKGWLLGRGTRTNNPSFEWTIQRRSHHLKLAPASRPNHVLPNNCGG